MWDEFEVIGKKINTWELEEKIGIHLWSCRDLFERLWPLSVSCSRVNAGLQVCSGHCMSICELFLHSKPTWGNISTYQFTLFLQALMCFFWGTSNSDYMHAWILYWHSSHRILQDFSSSLQALTFCNFQTTWGMSPQKRPKGRQAAEDKLVELVHLGEG